MAAVSCPAFTNVVVRLLPFHCTTEVLMKLLPLTVSVNAPEPALTVVGETDRMAGTGFGATVTLNVTEFEVPPPGKGLNTVTAGVPTAVISLAGMEAVSCADETKVVERGLPLIFTTDEFTKLVPFTVSVNAPEPATTLVGESVVTVGTGLFAEVTRNPYAVIALINGADCVPVFTEVASCPSVENA